MPRFNFKKLPPYALGTTFYWTTQYVSQRGPDTRLAKGPDNIWTIVNTGLTADITHLTWSGSKVFAQTGSNTYATSTDYGQTWTVRNYPAGVNGYGAATGYSSGWLIPTMSTSGAIYLTADDSTLTSVFDMGTGNSPSAVWGRYASALGGLRYYTHGGMGTLYQSPTPSTSGTWSSATVNTTGISLSSTPRAGNTAALTWFGYQNNTLKYISYDANGVPSILSSTSPFTGSPVITDFVEANFMNSGSVVAVTDDGQLATSSIGSATWTLQPRFLPSSKGFRSVSWFGNGIGNWCFMFITTDGHVIASISPNYAPTWENHQLIDITPNGINGLSLNVPISYAYTPNFTGKQLNTGYGKQSDSTGGAGQPTIVLRNGAIAMTKPSFTRGAS